MSESGLPPKFVEALRKARDSAIDEVSEGSAGGYLVTVKATGRMEVVDIKIDPQAFENREMLRDLLIAAVNGALRKARSRIQDAEAQVMANLPLPPGLRG